MPFNAIFLGAKKLQNYAAFHAEKLEFKQMVARLRLRQEQSELAHFALP
jgi:hypothetical protein